jgi:hypothetical protein
MKTDHPEKHSSQAPPNSIQATIAHTLKIDTNSLQGGVFTHLGGIIRIVKLSKQTIRNSYEP